MRRLTGWKLAGEWQWLNKLSQGWYNMQQEERVKERKKERKKERRRGNFFLRKKGAYVKEDSNRLQSLDLGRQLELASFRIVER